MKMRFHTMLLSSIIPLLPGKACSDGYGGDKWSVIEPIVTYGESLESVERKLRGVGLEPIVLPSTAIDPETLREKWGVKLTDEEVGQIAYYGITFKPDMGIYLEFDHHKNLIGFARALSATKDQFGKSVCEVLKQQQGPSVKTGVLPNTESEGTKSTDPPPSLKTKLVSRIENSILFGESPDDVAAKLKSLGLNPHVTYTGFLSPEEIGKAKEQEQDEPLEESLECNGYYSIDMTDTVGVVIEFNFYRKLIRYRNTHRYNSKMIGKRFSEVQADIEAKKKSPPVQ